MRHFKKQQTSLLLVFGVSIALSVIIRYYDYDLGVNLLTEIAGVALTVFIINRIIERRERQKRISIDQRILREIQTLVASYFSIWKHIIWQYERSSQIGHANDLKKIYPTLVSEVRISEKFEFVSLHHPESWDLFFNNRPIKDCFENYHDTLRKQIQQFIEDFKIYIEPELLDILLNIMDCTYFKEISLLKLQDSRKIVLDYDEDPDKLASYLRPDDITHIDHFVRLLNYSKNLKTLILQFTTCDVELYDLKEYFKHPVLKFS